MKFRIGQRVILNSKDKSRPDIFKNYGRLCTIVRIANPLSLDDEDIDIDKYYWILYDNKQLYPGALKEEGIEFTWIVGEEDLIPECSQLLFDFMYDN